MVNSLITLKVKSGPGDIIGETELPLVNNGVDFSKVQFNQPGEYVISVIPSNDLELEATEFTINILPEPEVIPQEPKDEQEPELPIDGNRPIIEQILQPNVNLEPIVLNELDGDSRYNQRLATSIGFTPLVWYNGTEIQSSDISSLYLYYDNLIPKCKLVAYDTMGLFTAPDTMPLNDSKFEIFISSSNRNLKSIHLKFKIEFNKENKNGTNTITGILDLEDFYKIKYDSIRGTSFEVLKEISKRLNLGFNSNISNTKDSMNWVRMGVKYVDYINDIIKHSYISDDSFMMGYIDYYWCFNYVDLEKEWKRDISNDVGINSRSVASLDSDDGFVVPMWLTNDRGLANSDFYIKSYKLVNNSTYLSTNNGTFTKTQVYNRNSKEHLLFNIDSLTSQNDKLIILKGAPEDKRELETNYISSWDGKIDTDNVHVNYKYAIQQNNRNLANLVNIKIELKLPNVNFNLFVYQKINIKFFNQKVSPSNTNEVNERLSGDWMIIDISFTWSSGVLSQNVVAVRKELGKLKSEIDNQIIPVDLLDNSELNENPFDGENLENEDPSSKYSIGDVYNFIDDNGISYEVTITEILANGTDIVGTVKKLD